MPQAHAQTVHAQTVQVATVHSPQSGEAVVLAEPTLIGRYRVLDRLGVPDHLIHVISGSDQSGVWPGA